MKCPKCGREVPDGRRGAGTCACGSDSCACGSGACACESESKQDEPLTKQEMMLLKVERFYDAHELLVRVLMYCSAAVFLALTFLVFWKGTRFVMRYLE